jgi:hypothetical protein
MACISALAACGDTAVQYCGTGSCLSYCTAGNFLPTQVCGESCDCSQNPCG